MFGVKRTSQEAQSIPLQYTKVIHNYNFYHYKFYKFYGGKITGILGMVKRTIKENAIKLYKEV